jgi:hypothetical protein
MSTAGQEGNQIRAALASRAAHGEDATQIADAIVSTWQLIDIALTPIIAQQGVAALYKRSLYLTVPAHSWLAGTHEGIQSTMDLALLKSVLVRQSSADAAACGGALLQTFYELLTSLVGLSLTERLLRSVWANSLSGTSAQDSP